MPVEIFLNTGDRPMLDEEDGKGRIKVFMEHSVQDLIGIGLPYLCLPLVPMMSASFVYDPTMKLLLYATVPEGLKTWPWFYACLTLEAYFVVMFCAIALPAWQVQVIAFELVNHKLQAIFAATTNR